ncbi:MAG TPA: diphosphate--fructose-6-phosphate 1-phosphotransferase [Thermodesulfovibrionales bacterium]|nr:diphosphate--fructose-6-phosphate 1-phosphotransferase [Thermodesulfovibrionales bacterium]
MAKQSNIGIIVGGGPAPGINGVISAAVIEAVIHGMPVVGINGGFKSLFDGQRKCAVPLTINDVSRIHNRGGSILRTSREFPERAREKFKTLLSTLKRLGIRFLITIGGEGTLFMANWIERESRGAISVVHVPKTIDNDIPLPGGVSTFGYQTARHWGVEIIENIMEDAKTTGRWYFITTMGRHSGHLALGMGTASGATISLIPEEFGKGKLSFRKVADILTCSIIKRLSMKKDHGVAVLAEGIAEKFDMAELNHHEQLESDETGRVRLSEIQLGRVLKNFVKENLKSMGLGITIVDKNIGYELRAADPIPYDVEYTRNLGYGAVSYLLRGGTGAMIVVYEGSLMPVPFVETINPSTGSVKVRTVDVTSGTYTVGRKYMIRLEKDDFSPQNIRRLAEAANLTVSGFRKHFGYLVDTAP